MHTDPSRTHRFGRTERRENDARLFVDYTALRPDVLVKGHLWNGQATESTSRCPKCHRIGVASAVYEGVQVIVHRGHVHGETLEGTDFCEVRFDEF